MLENVDTRLCIAWSCFDWNKHICQCK